MEAVDVLIVGGGPAGASAAIYAARAGLETLVVDRGLGTGAARLIRELENYPGVVSTSGEELLETMHRQAKSFGARFAQDRITGVDLDQEIKTAYGNLDLYSGRTLIIATGSMERASTVPGEEELIGRGVSYCATCDGAFFRGKTVAVVGSGTEALEEARHLARLVAKLYFITSKKELPGEIPGEVVAVTGATLQRIYGEGAVQGVEIRRGGSLERIEVQGVFIYLYGNRPVTSFLRGALPTDQRGCLQVDSEMRTAVPGVFAAGDVLCPETKQVVVAAAEGCRAALSAIRYLNDLKKSAGS
ncbi:MAG: FAD-dependent oxidoreductase [Dethiobacteria bacterium]